MILINFIKSLIEISFENDPKKFKKVQKVSKRFKKNQKSIKMIKLCDNVMKKINF